MPVTERLRRRELAGPLLQLEAWGWMILVRLLLACCDFPWTVRLLCCAPRRPPVDARRARWARCRVKSAVFKIWRRQPRASTCLHRALAAHCMLRRRGVATVLHYGARTEPGRGLIGHAWLMQGRLGVVGHLHATGYPILASWPAPQPQTPSSSR